MKGSKKCDKEKVQTSEKRGDEREKKRKSDSRILSGNWAGGLSIRAESPRGSLPSFPPPRQALRPVPNSDGPEEIGGLGRAVSASQWIESLNVFDRSKRDRDSMTLGNAYR